LLLVGSTEIAARLDPEEWRETASAYHRAAGASFRRILTSIRAGQKMIGILRAAATRENDKRGIQQD
jgi:hypothetical protein